MSVADLKSIKLVVVGDGAVGKTSLLMTYSQGTFPTEYVPTVFDNYSVEIDVMINDQQKTIELELWDTAGQEEYDRLRPLSYRNTDVFLIVFSVASNVSMENIRSKWRPEIIHYAKDTPWLLVGSMSDLRDRPEQSQLEGKPVPKEQGESLARELGAVNYIECSAKTDFNVKVVFDLAITSVVNPVVKKSKRKQCILL